MAKSPAYQSTTPRERFTQFIVLAIAEISLLAAVLLMFFIYSYGENLYLAVFSLGVLLVGSLLIRHSLQVAQIVMVLSIFTVQVIFMLNFKFGADMPDWLSPDYIPIAFVLADIIILVQIIRNSALPGERPGA